MDQSHRDCVDSGRVSIPSRLARMLWCFTLDHAKIERGAEAWLDRETNDLPVSSPTGDMVRDIPLVYQVARIDHRMRYCFRFAPRQSKALSS